MIAKPENLDLINWIINQDFVGQGYSAFAVQSAIWSLLLNDYEAVGGAATIAAAAQANGEGFMPGCNQFVGIILLPRYGEVWYQPVLIPRPVPCYEMGDETVWAKGKGFPGSNWSMYFCYTVD